LPGPDRAVLDDPQVPDDQDLGYSDSPLLAEFSGQLS
jgi:hypothetical protein